MAGYFVYNFDTSGLENNLHSLLQLPEILAIQIIDSEGRAFVSLWKENGEIRTGEKMAGA